jgi:light-regulated signal transduction histidine kinase (bacteriophytochrome)
MIPLTEKFSNKEILVVDDTPDNLRLLSAILIKRNFEVRKALNGKQALVSAGADAPDLILLDIKMPGLDGYDTCRALKENPDTRAIPVIFISALDDALDKVEAFAVGGADYISKPFQEAEVFARIKNQLYLRDLQQQLEIQNQKLIQSNQELEQFAHIVSHDLQQPLQSITGYTKIIGLQYSDVLDADAKRYLASISDAGNRMHRLIQDLLSYATVNEDRDVFTAVDCNIVLAEALSNLEILIQKSKAHIQYSELPKIYGRKTQLSQLFQNLIGNALKFSRPNIPPHIEISVSSNPDQYYVFEFRDNGIGIAPDDVHTIFQTFHRLHSNAEYPGSGIGLATCKKIVESHHGKIWVDSTPSEGSVFFVKLPSER